MIMPRGWRTSIDAPLVVVSVLIYTAFLLGGSSREDVPSLLILNPFSFLALGYFVWRLRLTRLRWRYSSLAWLLFSVSILHILALLPLPPQLFNALPGHELPRLIRSEVSHTSDWAAMTLASRRTLASLISLALPASVILGLALLSTVRGREVTLAAVLAFGSICLILGLLQATSGGSQLHLFHLTSEGSPVGTFANRNHMAIFLLSLLPAIAVFASSSVGFPADRRARQTIGAMMACVMIPLLLLVGSRAGIVLAPIAAIGALACYRPTDKPNRRNGSGPRRWRTFVAAAAIAVSLGAATIFFAGATAFDRLAAEDVGHEFRGQTFKPLVSLVGDYFPTGSGPGTFVEAYQIKEPQALLNATYLNHAHNDWLELAITFGLPGMMLALGAIAFLVYRIIEASASKSWLANDSNIQFRRAGCVVLSLLFSASLFDYPLRTPALAVLCAIAAVWAAGGLDLVRIAPADTGNRPRV